MEIFVHEIEEVPNEENHGNNQCNSGKCHCTAFDWHTDAAGISLSEFIGANAITAAALLLYWFSIRVVIVLFFAF